MVKSIVFFYSLFFSWVTTTTFVALYFHWILVPSGDTYLKQNEQQQDTLLQIYKNVSMLPKLLLRTKNTIYIAPHGRDDDYDDEEILQQHKKCASWVQMSDRKVLYINALKLQSYKENLEQRFMSGEFYVMASWEYAFSKNGFQVEEVTFEQVLNISVERLGTYHRIILGCPYRRWDKKCALDNDEEYLKSLSVILGPVKCKVGVFFWWDHEEDEVPGFLGNDFFRPKQVLTPFNWKGSNTFLGFFPHDAILNSERNDGIVLTTHVSRYVDRANDTVPKERIGLVLGKNGDFFDNESLRIIDALVEKNFTIHTTCRVHNCSMFLKRNGVINHKNLTPIKYSDLMKDVAFMMGIGNPIISPSPIVALEKGVPFLHPKRGNKYQHPPL